MTAEDAPEEPSAAAPRLSSGFGFNLLAVAVFGAGLIGWLVVLDTATSVAPHPWPTLAIVALAIACVFIQVNVVASGQHMTTFGLTDAAIVVAVLLGRPSSIPAAIIANMIIQIVRRRPSPAKVAINLGNELLGSWIAMVVFGAIRDDELVSVRTGLAAMLVGVIVGVVSAAVVGLASRLANGSVRAAVSSLLITVVGSFGNAAVALQAVYLGSIGLPLAIVSLLPLGLVLLVYRSVSRQQHTTDRTELLYRATSTLHEQPNLDDGLLAVLEEVRTAMRAERAQVVLLTADGAVTCEASSSSRHEMTAAAPSIEEAARRLSSELPGAALIRSGTPAATRGPLSLFASDDAIIAPLVSNGEPAGIVVVAGRAGGVYALYQSDVDLVEVLAKQVGLALERGFLERSLRQLIQLEQELTRQAFYDAVTGLANRNFLNDELARVLGSSSPDLHAVLLLDLDDFKTVNDSLGHVAGDRLLAVVAQRLLACVGDTGLVTRIGGDEFAVVMKSITSAHVAHDTASRIIESVSQLVELDGREVGVGASIGIRMTSGSSDLATDVLRDADLALYNAKSLGKGRYAIYEPEMHIQVQERLVLTAALANAVERDEFTLVFQPICSIESRRVAGAEALVRWRHPERGEIGPAQFLGLTEESGLIVGLGQHVLHHAIAALADWVQILGDESFYLSVNVSARQLKEPGFAESVASRLAEYSVASDRLVLEITESIFIDDVAQTKRVLDQIAATGVRISLDDFGTGYSSLSQLQQLPLHQLKIDQSFVRRLDPSRDGQVVVRAILQLAEAMNLEVVAEGIETEAQLQELASLGCKRGQGWLFSRPKSRDSFRELLLARVTPLVAAR